MNRHTFLQRTVSGAFASLIPGEKRLAQKPAPKPASLLAQTPPLGWNSYNSYGVYLHEKAAFENLEAFEKLLKPHGYEYFVIDGGWAGEYALIPGTLYPKEKHASVLAMDKNGLLEPGKTYWPNGLKPLINQVHAKGLKFGIHLMRGIPRAAVDQNLPIAGSRYRLADIVDKSSICKWYPNTYGVDVRKPGAQDYYNSVFRKLAQWGVDLVKVDDLIPFPDEILMIGEAIRNCGRPMLYSLSPGNTTNLRDLPYYRQAQMVRITYDIWDRVEDFKTAFNRWRLFQGLGTPGFWPDLDMIPFGQLQLMQPAEYEGSGREVRMSGFGNARTSFLSKTEMQTFITIRALAASPLMMGGDLPTLDDYSLALITNADMLACNQNGNTGVLVYDKNQTEVWLTNQKSRFGAGWFGIFNRSDQGQLVKLSVKELGLAHLPNVGTAKTTYKLHDIWNNATLPIQEGSIEVSIPANGVVFCRYEGARSA
ncbi:glycoside hydrolase family 27 protein [Rudanella lutea]|uniref:glycoside hydrolase family 27 protein n=1 Tax=Rudanella lutea TaxID=451374 RepID=UPI00037CF054|nr:glycoside hydrolase family 27 protein [Rudanella lutea]